MIILEINVRMLNELVQLLKAGFTSDRVGVVVRVNAQVAIGG